MAMTSGELTRGAAPTWRTVPAGEIGRFRGGSGFPLRFQGQASGEIPFFKVSDMNLAGNEKHMTRANHYISEAVRKQLGATLFPTGSIVFAKVGAAVFLERKRILAQPSCIDNNMAAFVLDASRADIEFVHQLLLTTRLADLVSATALPALNGADLAAMPVSLPPIDCQREVAKVLRGPDALLAKLDQLIAKKRDLKQAAMQQLLTACQTVAANQAAFTWVSEAFLLEQNRDEGHRTGLRQAAERHQQRQQQHRFNGDCLRLGSARASRLVAVLGIQMP